MDAKLAAAVAGTVRPGEVSGSAVSKGISRETFYKWRRRFLAEGQAGLEEQSRRPLSSPTGTATELEERIVRVRKELDDDGLDHGPWSIRQLLVGEVEVVASE